MQILVRKSHDIHYYPLKYGGIETIFFLFANTTPPFSRHEFVISSDDLMSPPVHASLHFGPADWMMTIGTAAPRRLSSHQKLSQRVFLSLVSSRFQRQKQDALKK